MGELIRFPLERRQHEPALDKKQFARAHGRSLRWVEQMLSEGMPSEMRGNKRVFFLSETRPWMQERGRVSA